jgi:hypothetical protein
MIAWNRIVLLIGGLMLLIDDDQTWLVDGGEQG